MGHPKPCGAAGTGALWAEWANTVPVVAAAADTTNNATSTIFLNMGVSLGSGGCGVGKPRHVLTRAFGLPRATEGPMRRAQSCGLFWRKTDVSGGRFYIRLRKRSYVLMFG